MNYVLQQIPNLNELSLDRRLEAWLRVIREKSGPISHRPFLDEGRIRNDVIYQQQQPRFEHLKSSREGADTLFQICLRFVFTSLYYKHGIAQLPDSFYGIERTGEIVYPRVSVDPKDNAVWELTAGVACRLGSTYISETGPTETQHWVVSDGLKNLRINCPEVRKFHECQCVLCSVHEQCEWHDIPRVVYEKQKPCFLVKEYFQSYLYWLLHDAKQSQNWCSTFPRKYPDLDEATGKQVGPKRVQYFCPESRNQVVLKLTGISVKQLVWTAYRFARSGDTLKSQAIGAIAEAVYSAFLKSNLFNVQPRCSFLYFRDKLRRAEKDRELPGILVRDILNVYYVHHIECYLKNLNPGYFLPPYIYGIDEPILDPLKLPEFELISRSPSLGEYFDYRQVPLTANLRFGLQPWAKTNCKIRRRVRKKIANWSIEQQFEHVMEKRRAYRSSSFLFFV